MSNEKEKLDYVPYTLVSHSILLPQFTMSFKVKGLKEIIANLGDEDLLQVTVRDLSHKDGNMTEFAVWRR